MQYDSFKALQGTSFLINQKKIIGRGMFGVIAQVIDSQNPSQKLCAKIIPLSVQYLKESIQSQLQILKQLPNHPNLVNTKKIQITSQNNFYLIMDYCNEGSFQQFIKKNPNISQLQIWELIKQFCRGYQVLYDNHLLHRDIKPDNILIHNGVLKISDFGLSRKVIDSKATMKLSAKGTPYYMAPELEFTGQGSSKVDVFSFGVVIFRLSFKGQYPFGSNYRTSTQYFQNLMDKEIQFPITPKRSPQLVDLITKMLQKDSKNRISWDKIFNHPKININKYQGLKSLNQSVKQEQYISQEDIDIPTTLATKRSVTRVNYLPQRINFRQEALFKTQQLISFEQLLAVQYLNQKLQHAIFRAKLLSSAIQYVNKKFQELLNLDLHPYLRSRSQNLMKLGYQQCLWVYMIIQEQISKLQNNIYVNKLNKMIKKFKQNVLQALLYFQQPEPQEILLATVRQEYPVFLYAFLTQFPDYTQDFKTKSRSMISILTDIYDSAYKFNYGEFFYERQTQLDQIDIGSAKKLYEYFIKREKFSFQMIQNQLKKYGLLII